MGALSVLAPSAISVSVLLLVYLLARSRRSLLPKPPPRRRPDRAPSSEEADDLQLPKQVSPRFRLPLSLSLSLPQLRLPCLGQIRRRFPAAASSFGNGRRRFSRFLFFHVSCFAVLLCVKRNAAILDALERETLVVTRHLHLYRRPQRHCTSFLFRLSTFCFCCVFGDGYILPLPLLLRRFSLAGAFFSNDYPAAVF
jgi:hypothetical protein